MSWEDFQREILKAVVVMDPRAFETRYGPTLDVVKTHNAERAAWVKNVRDFYARKNNVQTFTQDSSSSTVTTTDSATVFAGFINSGSSCYLDSVIVALFVPSYGGFFDTALMLPCVEVGVPTAWEARQFQTATPKWRNSVRRALAAEVRRLRDVTQESPWMLNNFRQLFSQCKFTVPDQFGEMREVDFSANQQQSAVDFLRYLFHVLCLRDKVSLNQRSTTLFNSRPEVVADPTLNGLCARWEELEHLAVTYEPQTASHLTDLDEARSLASAPPGTLYIVNQAGDRRRITAPEYNALFLCQLTGEDVHQQTVFVARDLVPNVELMNVDAHYRGNLFAKMHATLLVHENNDVEHGNVIIFEVSRSMGTRKINTRVDFGDRCGNHWILNLQAQKYRLRAVVCHQGSAVFGHYVCFVCVLLEDGEDVWCLYDDNNGHGVEVSADRMISHDYSPDRCGELFFYTLEGQ